MKNASKWLLYSGWGLFLISFGLPAFNTNGSLISVNSGTYFGWRATLECLKYSMFLDPILMCSVLTSLVMLATGLTMMDRLSGLKRFAPYLLSGCFALNLYPLFVFRRLGIGYWMWLASFAIVAVGMALSVYQSDAQFKREYGIRSVPPGGI
ncbi:MAG: hypothetical protein ABJA67_02945 [Chthonomonadales bacterium]